VYIYIYTYIHMYIYAYIYIYKYTYTHLHTYMSLKRAHGPLILVGLFWGSNAISHTNRIFFLESHQTITSLQNIATFCQHCPRNKRKHTHTHTYTNKPPPAPTPPFFCKKKNNRIQANDRALSE